MPWEETDSMTERQRLIDKHRSGLYTICELAATFGVSTKTARKWIKRALEGDTILEDRSRARKSHADRYDDADGIELILRTRDEHPHWGPKTIRNRLLLKHPDLSLPAHSTIGALLKRQGRITEQSHRRTRSSGIAAKPTVEASEPNKRWDCDYKGDFLLGNGRRCWPLTLSDGFSRLILAIQALDGTKYGPARRELERLMREYGLPETIRTDNGSPFVPFGGGPGLSRLTVWFMQLGIHHERTRPASPQDNAQHERMHRTLKAATTRPPAANARAQQRLFDEFRRDFNHDRPHQGLNDRTPASMYAASPRSYPSALAQPEYPAHWEKRLVTSYGVISFQGHSLYIGSAVVGFRVGLHEVDDGIWSIQLFATEVARFSEQIGKLA